MVSDFGKSKLTNTFGATLFNRYETNISDKTFDLNC